MGHAQVPLADRADGAPLSEQDGPWRLLIAAQCAAARWIRQIATIALSE